MAILTLTSTVLVVQPYTLQFAIQPSDVGRNETISPAVTVEVLEDGAVASGFAGDVTVELVGAGTLGGTLTVAAVAGVAIFDDLFVVEEGFFRLRVVLDDGNAGSIESKDFAVFEQAAPYPGIPIQFSLSNFTLNLEKPTVPMEFDAGDSTLEVKPK